MWDPAWAHRDATLNTLGWCSLDVRLPRWTTVQSTSYEQECCSIFHPDLQGMIVGSSVMSHMYRCTFSERTTTRTSKLFVGLKLTDSDKMTEVSTLP